MLKNMYRPSHASCNRNIHATSTLRDILQTLKLQLLTKQKRRTTGIRNIADSH